MTWKDKKKLQGEDKVNHDELNEITSIDNIQHETDLIQCGKCHTLHHRSYNHKCKKLEYFSWVCAICNRETTKWSSNVNNSGYSGRVIIRKTVVLWGKTICYDCIIQGNKQMK